MLDNLKSILIKVYIHGMILIKLILLLLIEHKDNHQVMKLHQQKVMQKYI